MPALITRLGVPPEVQEFFNPFLRVDEEQNLLFNYGEDLEYYSRDFHLIPCSENLWIAGNPNFHLIREVFICASAMEAIAWLSFNYHNYPHLENILFIATGTLLNKHQCIWIREHLKTKSFTLIFGKDLLGRIAALKVAAGIRCKPVELLFISDEQIVVSFRARSHVFHPDKLDVRSMEKAVGYRFGIRTSAPKEFDNFLNQLKSKNNHGNLRIR